LDGERDAARIEERPAVKRSCSNAAKAQKSTTAQVGHLVLAALLAKGER
jgi:hypothetical protein